MKRLISSILISSLSLYQASSLISSQDFYLEPISKNQTVLIESKSKLILHKNISITNQASLNYGVDKKTHSGKVKVYLRKNEIENLTAKNIYIKRPDFIYEYEFEIGFGDDLQYVDGIQVNSSIGTDLEVIDLNIYDSDGNEMTQKAIWNFSNHQLVLEFKDRDKNFSYLENKVYRVKLMLISRKNISIIEKRKYSRIDRELVVLENRQDMDGNGKNEHSYLGKQLKAFSGSPLLFGQKNILDKEQFM